MKQSVRSFVKTVAAKLPIFLFCILFIGCYQRVFGSANNSVGVVLLCGLLIFLKNDLAVVPKQAALLFPALFSIIAFAPAIAAQNAWVGLLVNFVAIFLLLLFSTADLSAGNHVTFLLGYLFCKGYPVYGELLHARQVSLVGGGVLLGLLYAVVHRHSPANATVCSVWRSLRTTPMKRRWYLQLSLSLALVLCVGDLLRYSHTMWVALAVLSLLQPEQDTARTRRKKRLPATLLAAALFLLLYELVIPAEYHAILMLVSGFAAMLLRGYFGKTVINSFNALLSAAASMPSCSVAVHRIGANLAGVLIALAAQSALWVILRYRDQKTQSPAVG